MLPHSAASLKLASDLPHWAIQLGRQRDSSLQHIGHPPHQHGIPASACVSWAADSVTSQVQLGSWISRRQHRRQPPITAPHPTTSCYPCLPGWQLMASPCMCSWAAGAPGCSTMDSGGRGDAKARALAFTSMARPTQVRQAIFSPPGCVCACTMARAEQHLNR